MSSVCNSTIEAQTHTYTCVIHSAGSVQINVVNWEEEEEEGLRGKESRVLEGQDVEVSWPHAEVNVYFVTQVGVGL